MELALWEAASQCEDDHLKPLNYVGSDVILLAFAVDSRDSFDNVTGRVSRPLVSAKYSIERYAYSFEWFEKATHWSPDAPIFLVACKNRSTS